MIDTNLRALVKSLADSFERHKGFQERRIGNIWTALTGIDTRLSHLEELDLAARVERLEDQAPIHITGNTEEAQRAIASLVSQLDDANAHIRKLTAQENAA